MNTCICMYMYGYVCICIYVHMYIYQPLSVVRHLEQCFHISAGSTLRAREGTSAEHLLLYGPDLEAHPTHKIETKQRHLPHTNWKRNSGTPHTQTRNETGRCRLFTQDPVVEMVEPPKRQSRGKS